MSVGFCMFPLQRLGLTICGSSCGMSVQMCMLFMEACVYLWSGGDACWRIGWEVASEGGILLDLWMSLTVEFIVQLIGSVAGFWSLCSDYKEPLSLLHDLKSPQTLQPCWSPQGSEWGCAEVGLLSNAWHYLLSYHFPSWEAWRGVFWHWAVLSCGRNVMVKLKPFLPSSVFLFPESLLKHGTSISLLYF